MVGKELVGGYLEGKGESVIFTHSFTSRSEETGSGTNTWPDVQSNLGTGNINGTAFSDGILDLIITSDSLTWNVPSDTFFLHRIYHFMDRVV